MIAKQNRGPFKIWFHQIAGKELQFEEITKNTCEFTLTKKQFKNLYNTIKAAGSNPHAAMFWYETK